MSDFELFFIISGSVVAFELGKLVVRISMEGHVLLLPLFSLICLCVLLLVALFERHSHRELGENT